MEERPLGSYQAAITSNSQRRKYYGPPLISIYISVRCLYKDVTNPVPMARTDVLSIALEIGAIVFMLNFMFIMFVVRSFGAR